MENALNNLYYVGFISKLSTDIGPNTPIWIKLNNDYNINPSFNFDEIKMDDKIIRFFILDLIITKNDKLVSILTYKKLLPDLYNKEDINIHKLRDFNHHSDEMFKLKLINDITSPSEEGKDYTSVDKIILNEEDFQNLFMILEQVKNNLKLEEENKMILRRELR
jgi:hypothetical protein